MSDQDDNNDQQEYLGDKVEKVIDSVGGKRIARAYNAVTKKPCNCKKRKTRINQLHKSYLERRQQIAEQRAAERKKTQDEDS